MCKQLIVDWTERVSDSTAKHVHHRGQAGDTITELQEFTHSHTGYGLGGLLGARDTQVSSGVKHNRFASAVSFVLTMAALRCRGPVFSCRNMIGIPYTSHCVFACHEGDAGRELFFTSANVLAEYQIGFEDT
ncbi:hypothetical protein J6590_077001 [Homalodisca vitripennis]|nr:hypothetical protein J6590_077001 [Homalodisca vitripennis]